VVKPNQMAVVTDYHLGGRDRPAVYGPGLHLKAPWPLARAEHHDVYGIRTMKIGTESDLKSEEEEPAILWTNKHTLADPEPMIVAATLKNETADTNAPLVALVNVEIYLHYRIKKGKTPEETKEHLLQYVRANADAESDGPTDRRLRNLATRLITRQLLRHTVDEWIGEARVDAGRIMREKIQKAADRAEVAGERSGLGVQILSVEVAGIHPPEEKGVAHHFHEVVAAGQEQKTAEQKAEQEAIKILSEAAGSDRQAREIVKLIDRLDRLEKQKGSDAPEAVAARKELAQRMRDAGGKASELIAQARADRWMAVNKERARVDRYRKQYEVWKQAPRWYAWNLYLKALSEGMADANKYLVLSRDKELILRGDFKKADVDDPSAVIEQLEQKNQQQP
ncbi:MAG: SPFH domain-containing protein, partial [Phycisphaeraceae bacterium]|nr:SPFH domain-containing protein [Phycisphaeraceae bacterium]